MPVSAIEKRRQYAASVAEFDPSLAANRYDGTLQVLVGSHAPGYSIHDDPDCFQEPVLPVERLPALFTLAPFQRGISACELSCFLRRSILILFGHRALANVATRDEGTTF